MSQQNVEIFKRGVQALNNWDIDAMLKESGPEVEWQPVLQVLLGGQATVFRGHDGIRAIVRDLRSAFAEIRIEIAEIHDPGDLVLGLGRVYGLSNQGVPMDAEYGIVVHYRDGLAVQARDWHSHAEALEAAGVTE